MVPDSVTYDRKAYTTVFAVVVDAIKIYTTHALEPRPFTNRPQYVTTQAKGFLMTSDVYQCRAAIAAYRIATKWAELQRDEAIQLANEKFSTPSSGVLQHTRK
ncbi:hypothetical protein PG985_003445 [Apiospora marii]|uniref:uncharacterized protein n=1 Tax=Apiospora marii TaxID=335849 RepID=UPI00312FF3B0